MTTDSIKNLLINVFFAIVAYLRPISGEINSLLFLFFINFVAGYLAAKLVQNEAFNIKKAFVCLVHATVFVVFVTAIFFYGQQKGNEQEALQCISYVSLIILYAYSINILKNLKRIFPATTVPNKVFSILYYVLAVEFIKQIPYLKNYENANKQ